MRRASLLAASMTSILVAAAVLVGSLTGAAQAEPAPLDGIRAVYLCDFLSPEERAEAIVNGHRDEWCSLPVFEQPRVLTLEEWRETLPTPAATPRPLSYAEWKASQPTDWPARYVAERAHELMLAMEPEPEPTPVPVAAPWQRPVGGQITIDELWRLARIAGWQEHRLDELASVACGHRNARHPTGESNCIPTEIGDRGRALGLLQIRTDYWPDLHARFDLLDPLENLQAGWIAFQRWEAEHGWGWGAWSVRP